MQSGVLHELALMLALASQLQSDCVHVCRYCPLVCTAPACSWCLKVQPAVHAAALQVCQLCG